MPVDYYYATGANLALLDTQISALSFATSQQYSGSEWLAASVAPDPATPLVLHWGQELTTAQETEVAAVVAAHDADVLTADQQAGLDAAAADLTELARIQALGVAARAAPPTITPAEETELLGLLERRMYG